MNCNESGCNHPEGECSGECLKTRPVKYDTEKYKAQLAKAMGLTPPHTHPNPVSKGYDSLHQVLREAFDQAAVGKGAERHAQGAPFTEQPMQKLIELYGLGFALGQAGKKMQEAQRMDKDAAKRELLGAINYIAGAVIHLEKA